MKCPLRYLETHYPDEQIGRDQLDCLKEECAWWIKEADQCAAALAPRHLFTLEKMLGLILDKMPHELQFRK